MSIVDPMDYLPTARFSALRGVSLAQALIAAAPVNPTELLQKWLGDIRLRSEILQVDLAARGKIELSKAKPADLDLDAAIGGLHRRLEGTARLPAERYPEAVQAQKLMGILFPKGLGWLNAAFDEQWAHVQVMLKDIDDKGLAAEIDSLAGATFLAEVRRAHATYGVVLGKTAPVSDDSVNLRDGIRSLSEAITGYTLATLGSVDPSRPETADAARQALKPVRDYKVEWSSKLSSAAKTVPPSNPVTPAQ